MSKYHEATTLSQFLRDHDVPCTSCGYNLRGGKSLTCPECGSALPYKSFHDFKAQYARLQRIESTEYRMYRKVLLYVVIVTLLDSVLILSDTGFADFTLRLLVAVLVALAALAIAYWRSKLYTDPRGADHVTNLRAERIRDRFGALSIILAIPVTALFLWMIVRVI